MTTTEHESDSRAPVTNERRGNRARRSVWQIVQLLRVRLRFVFVLLLVAVVVGQWEVLANYWSRFVGALRGAAAAPDAVSPDTEYFCPMCPGVLSNWPEKCPVCYMPLVRRQKGDAMLLPEGVIARMQLSPQRIQLAGIRTAPVTYRELAREITFVGHAQCDARRVRRVLAPVAGIVREIYTGTNWEQVREGEPLVSFAELPASKANDKTAVERALPLAAPQAGRVLALHVQRDQSIAAGAVIAEVADLRELCVDVAVSSADLPVLSVGQTAEITSNTAAAQASWSAKLVAIRPFLENGRKGALARFVIDNPRQDLPPGAAVMVRVKISLAEIEPYRSQPRNPPLLRPTDPRAVYLCPDHDHETHLKPGRCPHDKNELEHVPLADHQRIDWWCPMHPAISADKDGHECQACDGMKLLPRVVTYSPTGQLLVVPQTAVVDTGKEKLVYVESAPGMFDGVKVEVGERVGDVYAVLGGLRVGQRVASSGAFLIDAETRLNPNAATAYFGATTNAGSPGDVPTPRATNKSSPAPVTRANVRELLAKLKVSPEDRQLAETQLVCPITKMALGSMGPPVRVMVDGQPVLLCCDGCKSQAQKLGRGKHDSDREGSRP